MHPFKWVALQSHGDSFPDTQASVDRLDQNRHDDTDSGYLLAVNRRSP
jgi:hypothetical protein